MKTLIVCVMALAMAANAGALRIAGSDTMVVLNQEWSEEFEQSNPEIEVSVSGGGSEIGIRALQARETDIAASSRPLKAEEKARFKKSAGRDLIEIPVGVDVIAIYVHDNNNIPSLSMEQLKGIFTGKIRRWTEVGGRDQPIYVYIRNTDSGTHHFFKEHVLRGEGFWEEARPVVSTARMTEIISYNSNAIGFGGHAYARAARTIRVATPEAPFGFFASPEQVTSGKYPLTRSLFFYVDPASVSPELQRFVKWVLGEEGQSIVEGIGYYSLPKQERDKQLTRLGWGAGTVRAAGSNLAAGSGSQSEAKSATKPVEK